MTLVELMVAQSQSITTLTALMQQLVEHTSTPQENTRFYVPYFHPDISAVQIPPEQ